MVKWWSKGQILSFKYTTVLLTVSEDLAHLLHFQHLQGELHYLVIASVLAMAQAGMYASLGLFSIFKVLDTW